jgi:hypothetical protein
MSAQIALIILIISGGNFLKCKISVVFGLISLRIKKDPIRCGRINSPAADKSSSGG